MKVIVIGLQLIPMQQSKSKQIGHEQEYRIRPITDQYCKDFSDIHEEKHSRI